MQARVVLAKLVWYPDWEQIKCKRDKILVAIWVQAGCAGEAYFTKWKTESLEGKAGYTRQGKERYAAKTPEGE